MHFSYADVGHEQVNGKVISDAVQEPPGGGGGRVKKPSRKLLEELLGSQEMKTK